MPDQPAPPKMSFGDLMARGHALLDAGNLYAALSSFSSASNDDTPVNERTQALQMVGVVYRKIGLIERAVQYGLLSVETAKESALPDIVSGAARDLAASLHIAGIAKPKQRAARLRHALAMYEHSLQYDAIGRQQPFDDDAEAGPQRYVTQGMYGLLLYDMADYRIWLDDDGTERAQLTKFEVKHAKQEAIGLLIEASLFLPGTGVWELNNLLKLIQVTPATKRAPLVQRAEDLMVHYPSRVKELWLSMSGRAVMRRAISHQVWRMRGQRDI